MKQNPTGDKYVIRYVVELDDRPEGHSKEMVVYAPKGSGQHAIKQAWMDKVQARFSTDRAIMLKMDRIKTDEELVKQLTEDGV
jgi:hypothetical protein